MAQQQSFYGVDGTTKNYPQSKYIATKQHARIFLQRVDDITGNTWDVLSESSWDLQDNTVKLVEAASGTEYSQIEIRVADEADELSSDASAISIVASISSEIIVVAGIEAEVVIVAGDSAVINTVAGDTIAVNIVAGDTLAVNIVAGDTVALNLVSDDLAKGIGTNQPTDSAILNALTNANQTIADVILTNADVVLTHADVVITNGDVVITNADVLLTHADVVLTNADALSASNSANAAATSETNAANSASSIDTEALSQTALTVNGLQTEGLVSTIGDEFISFADGKTLTYIDGLGTTNKLETTLSIPDLDLSAYAGGTAYLFKEFGTNVGVASSQAMGYGQNRLQVDKWGVTTDDGLYKTTAKHGSAESETGFVSANSVYQSPGFDIFKIFNKSLLYADSYLTEIGTTTVKINYVLSEPRALDNFRMFCADDASSPTRYPANYTLKGRKADDTWIILNTTIGEAVPQATWSVIKNSLDTTTIISEVELEVTANNGDVNYINIGEIEFNFAISDAPYLNTIDRVVYDSTDTATNLVPIGETKVDGGGNTFDMVEYPVQDSYFNDIYANEITAEVFVGKNACTAWVNFDGTTTPPTINDSFNISDVVRVSAGIYTIYFNVDMDNINYTLSGLTIQSDTDDRLALQNVPLVGSFTVRHLSSAAFHDSTLIGISVIGGKE